jgi:hypothetical protein
MLERLEGPLCRVPQSNDLMIEVACTWKAQMRKAALAAFSGEVLVKW